MEGNTFIKIALLLSLQAINSNFSKRFLHNFNENRVLPLSLTFHVFVVRTFSHFSPNNLWQHRRLNLQRHQILQFPTNLQNCKNIKMPKVVRAEECCHILLSCYKILSSTILRTIFLAWGWFKCNPCGISIDSSYRNQFRVHIGY